MKPFLSVLIFLFVQNSFASAGDGSSATVLSKKDVTFFEVPLVCRAAPDIGCGSWAKPILNSFQKEKHVHSAWLNRQGTVMAVAWNSDIPASSRKEIQQAVSSKHNMNFQTMNGRKAEKMFRDFQDGKNWLRGKEVDVLSREEAGVISNRLVSMLSAKTELLPEKKVRMKNSLESEISKWLTFDYDDAGYEAKDEKKIRTDFENALISLTEKELDPEQLSIFKEVMKDMYTPQKNESNCSSKSSKKKQCCAKDK